MPIRVTGRFEYAAAFVLCATIQVGFGGESLTDAFFDWFASVAYYFRVASTLSLPIIETALVLVHGFAAAYEFRDPRFLLEMTSAPLNRRVMVW